MRIITSINDGWKFIREDAGLPAAAPESALKALNKQLTAFDLIPE